MISLGNIAYRWWITPEKDPNEPYFREVSESDVADFVEEKVGEATVYRNNKTREISIVKPSDPIIEKVDSSFSRLAQTVFDGALTGGISSKALSLLGFSIVRTVPGIVIGSALGAIKAYVDRCERPKEFILCVKSERMDELSRAKKELLKGDQIEKHNKIVKKFYETMMKTILSFQYKDIEKKSDDTCTAGEVALTYKIKLADPVSAVHPDDSKATEEQ